MDISFLNDFTVPVILEWLMAEAFAYMPHVLLNADARRSMCFQLYSTGIRTLPVITVV